MNQIIVNVGDLSIAEKQRVNVALAKVKNVRMCNPIYLDAVVLLYGPSDDGVNVGFGYYEVAKTTHTPQQVLAMAGMAPASEQMVLADTLIITDSSGNIIYDSTLDVANHGKGGALPDSGVSVKLNKNGAAVMVEKRKVRKDFDPGKEYSVNVADCTAEEKKEVQQAFFDVGIKWESHGEGYKYMAAVQYTNAMYGGRVTANLMYGGGTTECNMTAKEFLELVYGIEQVGHVHAELMALYAEDAKTSKTPWQLWEYLSKDEGWITFRGAPGWYETSEYRRKPKTHIVNGVEIPDLRVKPKEGDYYYLVNPASRSLFTYHKFAGDILDKIWVERGLAYQPTEEGKQAAILHAKAMLDMVQE